MDIEPIGLALAARSGCISTTQGVLQERQGADWLGAFLMVGLVLH
jgi:hypothetical protein